MTRACKDAEMWARKERVLDWVASAVGEDPGNVRSKQGRERRKIAAREGRYVSVRLIEFNSVRQSPLSPPTSVAINQYG